MLLAQRLPPGSDAVDRFKPRKAAKRTVKATRAQGAFDDEGGRGVGGVEEKVTVAVAALAAVAAAVYVAEHGAFHAYLSVLFFSEKE